MRKNTDHLSEDAQDELKHITAILLEEFDEAIRGKQASHRKAGRILKLIALNLRDAKAPDGVDIFVIVNHAELADKDRHWRATVARLRRDREVGIIRQEVRLDIYCLQDVNRALIAGEPYFTSVSHHGTLLYEFDRTPLAMARTLRASDRYWRGQSEFERWYPRAEDFLSGAIFYRDQDNMRMAALLLHQACEHLYQCVSWTLTLHGRRTHNLDELRAFAEGQCETLRRIWPRVSRFERRCFAQIRRAYVDARYEAAFPVSTREIEWTLERATMLYRQVGRLCREHLSNLKSSATEMLDRSWTPLTLSARWNRAETVLPARCPT